MSNLPLGDMPEVDDTVPPASAKPEAAVNADPTKKATKHFPNEPDHKPDADESKPLQLPKEPEYSSDSSISLSQISEKFLAFLPKLLTAFAFLMILAGIIFAFARHQEVLDTVQSQLDSQSYEAALDTLDDYPFLSIVSPELRRIRTETSSSFLEACISASENYAKAGNFSMAIASIRNGMERFPKEEALTARHFELWDTYTQQTLDAVDAALTKQDLSAAFEKLARVRSDDPPEANRILLDDKFRDLSSFYADFEIELMYQALEIYDFQSAEIIIRNALNLIPDQERLLRAQQWLSDNAPLVWMEKEILDDRSSRYSSYYSNNGHYVLLTCTFHPIGVDGDNSVWIEIVADHTPITRSDVMTYGVTGTYTISSDITGVTELSLNVCNSDTDFLKYTINDTTYIDTVLLWKKPPNEWTDRP